MWTRTVSGQKRSSRPCAESFSCSILLETGLVDPEAALSSMPLGLSGAFEAPATRVQGAGCKQRSALETDYIFNWTDRRRLFGAFARETAALSLLSCVRMFTPPEARHGGKLTA